MADGDVLVDVERELADGTRVTVFAVENASYPGGVNYRFAHYDPDSGSGILRFDNSRVARHGAGVHHRHEWCEGDEHVTAIEFDDLETHLSRFYHEVRDDGTR